MPLLAARRYRQAVPCCPVSWCGWTLHSTCQGQAWACFDGSARSTAPGLYYGGLARQDHSEEGGPGHGFSAREELLGGVAGARCEVSLEWGDCRPLGQMSPRSCGNTVMCRDVREQFGFPDISCAFGGIPTGGDGALWISDTRANLGGRWNQRWSIGCGLGLHGRGEPDCQHQLGRRTAVKFQARESCNENMSSSRRGVWAKAGVGQVPGKPAIAEIPRHSSPSPPATPIVGAEGRTRS